MCSSPYTPFMLVLILYVLIIGIIFTHYCVIHFPLNLSWIITTSRDRFKTSRALWPSGHLPSASPLLNQASCLTSPALPRGIAHQPLLVLRINPPDILQEKMDHFTCSILLYIMDLTLGKTWEACCVRQVVSVVAKFQPGIPGRGLPPERNLTPLLVSSSGPRIMGHHYLYTRFCWSKQCDWIEDEAS